MNERLKCSSLLIYLPGQCTCFSSSYSYVQIHLHLLPTGLGMYIHFSLSPWQRLFLSFSLSFSFYLPFDKLTQLLSSPKPFIVSQTTYYLLQKDVRIYIHVLHYIAVKYLHYTAAEIKTQVKERRRVFFLQI